LQFLFIFLILDNFIPLFISILMICYDESKKKIDKLIISPYFSQKSTFLSVIICEY